MKINKLYLAIIFVFFLILSFSCQKFVEIETEEYTLNVPKFKNLGKNLNKDSTNIDFIRDNSNFSIWIIRKKKSEFISLNDCISKELEFFLKDKKAKNVLTQNTYINGSKAIVISGVNNEIQNKYYWTFAVFDKNYYYFIIRIGSFESKFSFNEYYNSKILQSFNLK